ncbi:hypothetical protein, partial [Pantoea dispersa]
FEIKLLQLSESNIEHVRNRSEQEDLSCKESLGDIISQNFKAFLDKPGKLKDLHHLFRINVHLIPTVYLKAMFREIEKIECDRITERSCRKYNS